MTRPTPRRRSRPLLAGALAASLSAIALAGCGFHLQGLGENSIPMVKSLQLDISGDTPQNLVARDLRQDLDTAGVSVQDQAPLQMNVGTPDYQESQMGYGGSGGNQQRDIVLEVPYSIQRTSDGAYVTNQQHVQVRGSYNTSTNQLLQRDHDRDALKTSLARQAASLLVERLRAASTSTNAVTPDADSSSTQ